MFIGNRGFDDLHKKKGKRAVADLQAKQISVSVSELAYADRRTWNIGVIAINGVANKASALTKKKLVPRYGIIIIYEA